MMKITVWTKPNCVQCDMTKKEFDKRGIVYEEKNLQKNPKAVERFIADGLLAAPIVTTDIKQWSGFRLSKIESLHDYLRSSDR